MISPCYTTEHQKSSVKNNRTSNTIDYLEFKHKKLLRQAYIRKQQQRALRRFILFCVFLICGLFVLIKSFNYYIYKPFVNSKYNINVDKNFFHSSESMLARDSVLGYKYLFENPYKYGNDLMKPIPLGRELRELKYRLLPIVSSDNNYKAGIFIWDAQTHDYVSINGEDYFATASIIKIPVLIELFRQIDQNLHTINQRVEFTRHHLSEGSGSLQYRPLGNYHTLDYLASIMIEHSDNSATNIILDEIGGTKTLNNVMKSWGLKKSHMENWLPDLSGTNMVSPADFAKMLYNLDNTKFLSESSRQKIFEYMTKIKNRNLIKCGLPAGAKLAHKTGDIGSMVGDAGVVTLADGRKYIIVAMVERPWNSYKAKDIIREASRVTFNYFSNN
ncbi:MAG: serine hydrolase [Cyanobacteriota bacterium]